MKSNIRIYIIILLQIFFAFKSISDEIEFEASDIKISNDQNLTIANNGRALIKDDGIIAEGKKIKYFRNESLLIIDNGKISSIDQNFEINSNLYFPKKPLYSKIFFVFFFIIFLLILFFFFNLIVS